MDNFLKYNDSLSAHINAAAQRLYNLFQNLDVRELGFSQWLTDYFNDCHSDRPFFSIQTSAELLYRSIKLSGREPAELVVADYGAGVGSLYLLAKMIGCQKVVYVEIVAEVADAGKKIADHLDIPVDLYVLGDHHDFIRVLQEEGIDCDLILSRNVMEHIYDLGQFYTTMRTGQPAAIHYASTTANFQNPAMLMYHKKLHRKHEPGSLERRREIIKEQFPLMKEEETDLLAAQTRGLAGNDIIQAVNSYITERVLPDPSVHYTNTCDPDNGMWYEHIIPIRDYRHILEPLGFHVDFKPGFWDTHYASGLKNVLGRGMNVFGRTFGEKAAIMTAPFIYIVLTGKH